MHRRVSARRRTEGRRIEVPVSVTRKTLPLSVVTRIVLLMTVTNNGSRMSHTVDTSPVCEVSKIIGEKKSNKKELE